jgi:hypothetical protein
VLPFFGRLSRRTLQVPNTNQNGQANSYRPMTGAEIRGRQESRTGKLSPPLQIPKNRSTGNLAGIGRHAERARYRLSYDASSAMLDYESMTRFVALSSAHAAFRLLATPHTGRPSWCHLYWCRAPRGRQAVWDAILLLAACCLPVLPTLSLGLLASQAAINQQHSLTTTQPPDPPS